MVRRIGLLRTLSEEATGSLTNSVSETLSRRLKISLSQITHFSRWSEIECVAPLRVHERSHFGAWTANTPRRGVHKQASSSKPKLVPDRHAQTLDTSPARPESHPRDQRRHLAKSTCGFAPPESTTSRPLFIARNARSRQLASHQPERELGARAVSASPHKCSGAQLPRP